MNSNGDLGQQALMVTTRMAIHTLPALMRLISEVVKKQDKGLPQGQQSLKDLSKQGKQLEDVKLTGDDVKVFRKELNQLSVDYSVKKDRSTGEHVVFFKAQDISRIHFALKKCVEGFEKPDKKPIKEVFEEAGKKAAERTTKEPMAHDHEKAPKREDR